MTPFHHHNVKLPVILTPGSEFPPRIPTPQGIVERWIARLQTNLIQHCPDLSALLHKDSWWRDMLAFAWDFYTVRGQDKIEAYIARHQPQAQIAGLRLHADIIPVVETPQQGLTWMRAVFEFQNSCEEGLGVVYLTCQEEEESNKWKAYAVYTALQMLQKFGIEDSVASRRGDVVQVDSMPGGPGRCRQPKFKEKQPTVMVLGAGQSGLNISARLQVMGISCLLVEQNKRVGDNWRNRYSTLVLHNHVDITHLAYLPFPENWPTYSSKDDLADWFETYAKALNLNIWLNLTSVTVIRNHNHNNEQEQEQEQIIHPSHIVWSAGQFGMEKIPDLPNKSIFQGTVYHSNAHKDASLLTPTHKKVIIVGTGNSRHDIAEDFYKNGAQVTLLQRSGTYVLGQAGIPLLLENTLIGSNIPLDIKALLSESLPWPVTLALCRQNTADTRAADQTLLAGLEQAGLKLDYGPNGQGILGLYVHRRGGYYIEFGCSQLITDGKIAVWQCGKEIAGFDKRHLLLCDGSRLEADIVVFVTGYHGPLESVRRVLGHGVVERCHKELWGLDGEGEIRTVWHPSGHPGFWFMEGNLAQSRVYSRFVALQIAAIEAGLV
ncbi:hypothetical protein BDV23DRAFT_193357 [Aspergillus alliaceus]|uniref:FAD/NAD(P)-binding domain-containing protein n=1 Tax=Petromyces alliaceus TaxID=209559 RepID=A0A5N7CAI5_PETAA|nr:hypothetical protein BDV23DRAFT_193357 [Aspergillus alliaceus]